MKDRTLHEYAEKIFKQIVESSGGDAGDIALSDIEEIITHGLLNIKKLTDKGLEPLIASKDKCYCFSDRTEGKHWNTYKKIRENPKIAVNLVLKKIKVLCKNDPITDCRYVVLRNSELDRFIKGLPIYSKFTFRSLRAAEMYSRYNDKAVFILKCEDCSTNKIVKYEKVYYKRVWRGIIKRFS